MKPLLLAVAAAVVAVFVVVAAEFDVLAVVSHRVDEAKPSAFPPADW